MAKIIHISIKNNTLDLFEDKELKKQYAVSTSRNGTGNEYGKEQTPLGRHRICEKIGKDVPVGGIFKERCFKSEISPIYKKKSECIEELPCITTRVLWLEGLDKGLNAGEGIGSYERKIYIHGTPYEYEIGKPASLGCIRMKNQDIVEFFDVVAVGDEIKIIDE